MRCWTRLIGMVLMALVLAGFQPLGISADEVLHEGVNPKDAGSEPAPNTDEMKSLFDELEFLVSKQTKWDEKLEETFRVLSGKSIEDLKNVKNEYESRLEELPEEMKKIFIRYFYESRIRDFDQDQFIFYKIPDNQLRSLVDIIDIWPESMVLGAFLIPRQYHENQFVNPPMLILPDAKIMFLSVKNKYLEKSGQFQFPWDIYGMPSMPVEREDISENFKLFFRNLSNVIVAVNVVATRYRREVGFIKTVSDISKDLYGNIDNDECQMSWEKFSSWKESNKQVLANSGSRLAKLRIVREAVVHLYVVFPSPAQWAEPQIFFFEHKAIPSDSRDFIIAYNLPPIESIEDEEKVGKCFSNEEDVKKFMREALSVGWWDLLKSYLDDSDKILISSPTYDKLTERIDDHQSKAITGRVNQNSESYARHGLMESVVAIKTPDGSRINGTGFFVDACTAIPASPANPCFKRLSGVLRKSSS